MPPVEWPSPQNLSKLLLKLDNETSINRNYNPIHTTQTPIYMVGSQIDEQ